MNPEAVSQKPSEILSPTERAKNGIATGFKHVSLLMQCSTYNNPDNPNRLPVSDSVDAALGKLIMAEINLNNGNMAPVPSIITAAENDIKLAVASINNNRSQPRNPTTGR